MKANDVVRLYNVLVVVHRLNIEGCL